MDLVKGDPAARRKAESLDAVSERGCVAAPALTELLVGAYHRGGMLLRDTLDLVSSLQILETDEDVAAEAARIGAELLRRGEAMSTIDLLIAATAKLRQMVLLTRDTSFSRVHGLAVETY